MPFCNFILCIIWKPSANSFTERTPVHFQFSSGKAHHQIKMKKQQQKKRKRPTRSFKSQIWRRCCLFVRGIVLAKSSVPKYLCLTVVPFRDAQCIIEITNKHFFFFRLCENFLTFFHTITTFQPQLGWDDNLMFLLHLENGYINIS